MFYFILVVTVLFVVCHVLQYLQVIEANVKIQELKKQFNGKLPFPEPKLPLLIKVFPLIGLVAIIKTISVFLMYIFANKKYKERKQLEETMMKLAKYHQQVSEKEPKIRIPKGTYDEKRMDPLMEQLMKNGYNLNAPPPVNTISLVGNK